MPEKLNGVIKNLKDKCEELLIELEVDFTPDYQIYKQKKDEENDE